MFTNASFTEKRINYKELQKEGVHPETYMLDAKYGKATHKMHVLQSACSFFVQCVHLTFSLARAFIFLCFLFCTDSALVAVKMAMPSSPFIAPHLNRAGLVTPCPPGFPGIRSSRTRRCNGCVVCSHPPSATLAAVIRRGGV